MTGIKKVIALYNSNSGQLVGYVKGVLQSKNSINVTYTKEMAKKYVSDDRIQDEIDKVTMITNGAYICMINEL